MESSERMHDASPAAVADELLAELAPDLAKAGQAATTTTKNLRGFGSIYRRGPTWWIRYSHRGHEVRESANSAREQDAIKLLKVRVIECGKGRRRDPAAEQKVRMGALLDALEADYRANGRRSIETLAFRVAPLREAFGQDRAIDVTAGRIKAYRDRRVAEGKAPATVNRELAALRRAFALAVEAEVLSVAPVVKLLAEENARQGFVTRTQFDAITAALPDYLKDAARFGYLTGWRRGEIVTLEWRDVDLEAGRITLRREESKNKQPRTVPFDVAGTGAGIFAQLDALITRRVATRTASGDGARYVFHRDGHRLRDFRHAWQTACTAAGHPTLLFHDLRRSAVRNFSAAGVPDRAAMRITGHRTRAVYDRYNIVSDDDVRAALERVNGRAADGDAMG